MKEEFDYTGMQYRLKIYHCGYNKGNVITYDDTDETFGNPYLSQWRRLTRWSFQKWYIDKHPEIFEKI